MNPAPVPRSGPDSTSPQSLAMMNLLGSQNEADSKVLTLTGEQQTLFKSVAMCMAQGMPVAETAKYLEIELDKAKLLYKQPQVIEELKNLTPTVGSETALANLLAGTVVDSVMRLIDLRDNAKSETVKYNSATKLIDLATKNPDDAVDDLPTDPVERARVLQQRLDALREKTK